MKTDRYNMMAVVGPTASGKTAFASHLAYRLDGEVVSADSRQVYRKMNLGTGKDYKDYLVKDKQIPVHLIDRVEPGYKYNLFEYQRDFIKAWKDIRSRKKIPILCGGSGLYIHAVTDSYRLANVPVNENLRRDLEKMTLEELALLLQSMKKLHNKTDTDTRAHAIRAIEIEHFSRDHQDAVLDMPVLRTLFIGIRYGRHEERNRITERLQQRLKQGMVDEVRNLLQQGLSYEDLMYYGLEYKYIAMHLAGKITYEDMVAKLNTAIHQYAKRQMTWYRKMEREGTVIHWINGTIPMEDKLNMAMTLI
jgi:tRNA dimethylallyltransferase